jgi:DNA invertase Pin-like site-specific DNA recombinase
MKTAFSYLRFSTAEQKLGDSTGRQLRISRDWCRMHELEPDETLSMTDEGFSAYKGEQITKGALGVFSAAVRDGKFPNHVLVAENLDRISRQGPKLARKIIEQIVDNGVDIHIANIAVELTPGWENDPAKSIIVDVELGRAWKESQYKSDRIGSAWRSKKSKATNGLAITASTLGWLKARKGESVTVVPQRAAAIRRIFQLAALGLGGVRIIRQLVKEGHKPFGTSGKWTLGYIQLILSNRSVLGEYQPLRHENGKKTPEGEPIPNFYPAVVTYAEWEAARAAIDAKNITQRTAKGGSRGGGRQSDNIENLFSGLIWDISPAVPRRMYFNSKGASRYAYLVTRFESKEPAHRSRYDQFEKAFLGFLEDLDWQSVAGESESDEVKAAQRELENVLSETDRTSQRITQLQKLVDEGAFSKALFETLDAHKAQLIDYTSHKEALIAEVNRAHSKAAALYSPEALIEAIRSGDVNLRLKLKAEIAKRVEKIGVNFNKTGSTTATIVFANGARKAIIFKGDSITLAQQQNFERPEIVPA